MTYTQYRGRTTEKAKTHNRVNMQNKGEPVKSRREARSMAPVIAKLKAKIAQYTLDLNKNKKIVGVRAPSVLTWLRPWTN